MEDTLAEVSFGEWLKRRRKAAGLTQEQLALQIHCSTSALKKIEAEDRRPSAQTVERLAEVFNIPSSERANLLRFARGDWRSAPRIQIEASPWHSSTQTSHSKLPAAVASLIGREKEIADVREYLLKADIRLVTLIGPPGIGKTRLSLEAAHASLSDFLGGVFFVALASLDDPFLIAATMIQALGFVEEKNLSASRQLTEGIGDKQMLILLDNCEHLIEDVAELASGLLSACSRLKILVTSREALRVPGEWLYSVPALDVPDASQLPYTDIEALTRFSALALFAERARAVRSDFTLDTNNIQSVAAICAQLDGLPLAIELIAARIRLMSPESLLQRMNEQFILSADGMRAVSARQKTLNNAIRWSYNLLSEEEQNLFAQLSVFSGGFTLEAAESIFSRTIRDNSVADLMTLFLDKSLLQRIVDREASGESRFNMLVTIQQFALDRLRHMGEEAEVRNRHLAYFLDLAEQADKEIHGPNQLKWLDCLENEHDNFRAGLDWCVSEKHTESALRLLGALGWSWNVRGHYGETHNWFDLIRVLPEITVHPTLYARLLNHIGLQNWLSGELYEAQSVLNESQAIWLTLGIDGEQGMAEALRLIGMVALSSERDNKMAQSLSEQSLELYQKHGEKWGIAAVMFNLGWIADERNDDALALSLLEQSLDQFSQLGDLWGMGRVSGLLGQLFLKQGNNEKARLLFEQHLRIDEEIRFKQGTVVALQNLGTLYHHKGNYDQAEQFYEKSLAICREYGLNDWGFGLYCLGLVALHRNNYPLAGQHFTDNFNLARKIYDENLSVCDFLTGLAAIAAGTSQPERAAKLYGAAQALFETTDYRIPPFDLVEFDRHIQIARDQLGEVRFESLQAEGRTMTMEQAVAYALKA